MFDFFIPIIFAPIRILEKQKSYFNLTTNLFLLKNIKKYNNTSLMSIVKSVIETHKLGQNQETVDGF